MGPLGREVLGSGSAQAGTLLYMSPEQIRGEPSDARSDLYSLGCMLYQALTGRPPFEGHQAAEVIAGHLNVEPRPPSQLSADVPPQLDQLVRWCMAKRPEDRPQTPMQLAAALQPFCPGARPSGAHPAAPPGAAPYPAPGYAPAPLPLPLPNPHSSSQVFRLPTRSNDEDPIRRRATAGFPFALVGIGCGADQNPRSGVTGACGPPSRACSTPSDIAPSSSR